MKHLKSSMEFEPLLHCGNNDLRPEQTANQLRHNIIELGKTIKNGNNDFIISSINDKPEGW